MESGWFGQVTLGRASKLQRKKKELNHYYLDQGGCIPKREFTAEKNDLWWFEGLIIDLKHLNILNSKTFAIYLITETPKASNENIQNLNAVRIKCSPPHNLLLIVIPEERRGDYFMLMGISTHSFQTNIIYQVLISGSNGHTFIWEYIILSFFSRIRKKKTPSLS